MDLDQTTHTLLHGNEYQTLINAVRIINVMPDTLVTQLENWKNLNINDEIPDADIQRLKEWITKGKSTDHSRKVVRLLLWYIFKIHLRMPQFQSVVPNLSF